MNISHQERVHLTESHSTNLLDDFYLQDLFEGLFCTRQVALLLQPKSPVVQRKRFTLLQHTTQGLHSELTSQTMGEGVKKLRMLGAEAVLVLPPPLTCAS